jgi:hypothetical protein
MTEQHARPLSCGKLRKCSEHIDLDVDPDAFAAPAVGNTCRCRSECTLGTEFIASPSAPLTPTTVDDHFLHVMQAPKSGHHIVAPASLAYTTDKSPRCPSVAVTATPSRLTSPSSDDQIAQSRSAGTAHDLPVTCGVLLHKGVDVLPAVRAPFVRRG